MAKIDRLDVPGTGAFKAFTLLLEAGNDLDLADFLPGISEKSLLSYIKSAADAGEYRPLARFIILDGVVPRKVGEDAVDKLPTALNAALIRAYMDRDVPRLEAMRELLDRLGGLDDGDRMGQRELAQSMLQMKEDHAAFVKTVPVVQRRVRLKR